MGHVWVVLMVPIIPFQFHRRVYNALLALTTVFQVGLLAYHVQGGFGLLDLARCVKLAHLEPTAQSLV